MPTTLSPLRYPGGKTQLYSFVKHTIAINHINNAIYSEPFCGGSGIAVSLLLHNIVDSIILNDYDSAIYSVWYAILNETDRFVKTISDTPVTIDEWDAQNRVYRNAQMHNQQDYNFNLGFAAFFLNRTNRSGIITGGPIGGHDQDSGYKLDCRFNKKNLIQKIKKIAEKRNSIRLYHMDAKDLIHNVLIHENRESLFVYFDPPYYKQGQNLYKNFFSDDDHVQLSNAIREMDEYKWITTYDNEPRIREIYDDRTIQEYRIQYSANKTRKEIELIFHSPETIIESYGKVRLN